MNCTILLNGRELKVKANTKLLWAALDNGFYIPNLCAIRKSKKPSASCRLCYVEIAGRPSPVTSCTETVFDGMQVRLESAAIKRLRKSAFDLLLSNHRIDCRHCSKKKNCELHTIARSEGFKLVNKNLKTLDFNIPVDSSHPLFSFDRNKCVLCGRCVWACNHEGTGVLDFAYRGISTAVSTFAGIPLAETTCNSCLACVAVCPVGSLYCRQPKAEVTYV